MLKADGYTVLEAENADAALRIFDEADQIDILFTDIVMPGMNGLQLARAAASRRPGLETIFTSGYAWRSMEEGWIPEPLRFLMKPYRADELGAKIRTVFSEAS